MSFRYHINAQFLGTDTPPTPSPTTPTSHSDSSIISRDTTIMGTKCPDLKEYARLNRSSELQWLNFEIVSNDGGQFSEDYKCEHMLDNDASVFCTLKKENTNIVLKISESTSFILTHILIKAPEAG